VSVSVRKETYAWKICIYTLQITFIYIYCMCDVCAERDLFVKKEACVCENRRICTGNIHTYMTNSTNKYFACAIFMRQEIDL